MTSRETEKTTTFDDGLLLLSELAVAFGHDAVSDLLQPGACRAVVEGDEIVLEIDVPADQWDVIERGDAA